MKALEEQGIGRPSTYAPTIGTLLARSYVTVEERKLAPTELGMVVNDLLVEQEDYPLNRLLDTALGLHEGTVAAKAMIVPRVD